jgi:hypothetical protein
MMAREWQAILARHGQRVTVFQDGQEDGTAVRAFLQPVREKNTEQEVPSPLGMRRDDRFLYLGPVEVPLEARKSRVVLDGQNYQVQMAHLVGNSHWWGILRPEEET